MICSHKTSFYLILATAAEKSSARNIYKVTAFDTADIICSGDCSD